MPRVCTICSHDQRAEIEAAIVASVSYRDIAGRFSVSRNAAQRHKEHCLKPAIQIAQEQHTEELAWDALADMVWMRKEARAIYKETRDSKIKDHRISLQALGELRKQTELHSELTGELDRGSHIEFHQEWINMREIIFHALEPFPEARYAVAKALLAPEEPDGHTRTS